MLRISVEIDETDEYTPEETKKFAESLSTFIKKKLNRKLNSIDCNTDWFAGFVALPANRIKDVKEAFSEWADSEGVGAAYCIKSI